jgi:hypothetical protein
LAVAGIVNALMQNPSRTKSAEGDQPKPMNKPMNMCRP